MKPSSGGPRAVAAPSPASRAAATAAAPKPSASPFICLSTQCDLLYRIGPQVHPYAAISEQSVFQRAAEQLRFVTPSPLAVAHTGGSAPSRDALTCAEAADVSARLPASPCICVADHLPAPFACIADFESAAQARPAAGTAMSASPAARAPDVLVPSGALLAYRACRADLAHLPPHAARTDEFLSTASTVASPPPPPPPPPPQPAEEPTQLMFPAPVLLRAVAQMVLSMQTAALTTSSAARFCLTSYRGVSLAGAAPLPQPHTSRRSAEALVFSVLPQVVANHLASTGAGQATDAATLFALRPRTSSAGLEGRKRARVEPPVESPAQGTAAAAEAPTAAVMAGPVWCERLTVSASEEPRADLVATRYAAVSAEVFGQWSAASVKAVESTAANCAEVSAALYTAEDAWMSDGVFQSLFMRPADASATAAATGTTESAGSGEAPPDLDSVSDTLFVKTSAFLLLAFLVHHSWCAHITVAITRALQLRQLAQQALQVSATHVTCLPAVHEVRRPPQYEWRSVLTFNVQRSVVGDSNEKDTAAGCEAPVLFRLTVQVHHRTTELTWWRVPHATLSDRIASVGTAAPRDAVATTGTLDSLLRQI